MSGESSTFERAYALAKARSGLVAAGPAGRNRAERQPRSGVPAGRLNVHQLGAAEADRRWSKTDTVSEALLGGRTQLVLLQAPWWTGERSSRRWRGGRGMAWPTR
jgi:hypothetical protein